MQKINLRNNEDFHEYLHKVKTVIKRYKYKANIKRYK